jgi:monoamine oxidase
MDSDWDIVIVGAGAAGIAAGRHLAEAGTKFLVLEARDRVGGRALTVGTDLGVAVDLGCEWLHSAERNPWTGIAGDLGFEIDRTLPDWGQRVTRHGGEVAQRAWFAAAGAYYERLEQAAATGIDRPASDFLAPGGEWNGLLGAISTWANGTEPERLSILDYANYSNDMVNWRVLKGYGTLIATYGSSLPVRLSTPVRRIDHRGRRILIETDHGTLDAGAAIVTMSTNLLAAEPPEPGAIAFLPDLPAKRAAARGVPLGIANKLFLGLSGPPEDFPRDRHEVGATDRAATGSYQLRPHGWPMISCYYGGRLAAELDEAGADAMAAFALDELAGLFGGNVRTRLDPLAASAWVADPWARGSYSIALPGHAGDRGILAEPIDDRLFFAGEACSIEDFGTAHGAFASGRAAAERALAALVG